MRIIIALVLLTASLAMAHAFGLGLGNQFGLLGAAPKTGAAAPPSSGGKLLRASGSNFILQTNGTSKICLAGGC